MKCLKKCSWNIARGGIADVNDQVGTLRTLSHQKFSLVPPGGKQILGPFFEFQPLRSAPTFNGEVRNSISEFSSSSFKFIFRHFHP